MHFYRTHKLGGQAHYRVKYLMDNTQGLYDGLEEELYTACLEPAMLLDRTTCHRQPYLMTVTRLPDGYIHLSWMPATDNDKRNVPTYVIYGSDTYPVDTLQSGKYYCPASTRNGIHVRPPVRFWTAKKYLLSLPLDRCGNESEAAHDPPECQHQRPPMPHLNG